jgi:hypothetical protein
MAPPLLSGLSELLNLTDFKLRHYRKIASLAFRAAVG